MSQIIKTDIPGMAPIELVEYYNEFLEYYPRCEMETKGWFVEHVKSNWTIIDCGAHIGYYSILFSNLAAEGIVYAFEPTSTVDMLKINLEHNKVTNVHIFNQAVGKHCGRKSDRIYRIWGKAPEIKDYDFISIDEFVQRQSLTSCNCIKIDVDSYDFEVLQGAEQTLRRFDPYVVVELNHALEKRGQNNMAALQWMSKQGYKRALCLDGENFVFKMGLTLMANDNIQIMFGSENR